MKIIANIFRLFVGLLFIFSGLIKSNDPTGFSYKLDEYFSVFAADLETDQDSVTISVNSPDGLVSKSFEINANNPVLEVNATNEGWVKLPEYVSPTPLYTSLVKVTSNNTEVYSTIIEAEDSSGIALELGIHASVNGEKESSTIALSSLRKENFNLSFDNREHLKENGWYVDFLKGLREYALALAIFICVLEIVLGLALLIGFAPKLTIWLLLLLIIFFTFLTWYSASFNKVTDCGCFGDAIPLTPWESFYKDLILLGSSLIILFGLKYIKPIFSNPFAVRLLTVATILCTAFSVYCYTYLPVKNYLRFKEGNNIEELAVVPEDAPSDVYENIFIYSKDGVEEEFTLNDMSNRNLKEEGYVFVDRVDKLISKGFEPEIHDFKIMDETRSNDYVQDFFDYDNYKLLVVMNEVEKANLESLNKLNKVVAVAKEKNVEVYPLTASSSEAVAKFKSDNNINYPFYYGDKTNLKSIIRSNPGLVLLDSNNVVIRNWASRRIPKPEKFLKKLK